PEQSQAAGRVAPPAAATWSASPWPAGRLLEAASNRRPREMTAARSFRGAAQNPAYRSTPRFFFFLAARNAKARGASPRAMQLRGPQGPVESLFSRPE